jgi:glutaredoxin 3
MASLFRLGTVAKLIQNHNLVMFSKTFCPFCLKAKAKATLKDIGVSEMKVVELDEDKDGDSLQVHTYY